jgi:prepilin-type N-terminal cleavage/methylation domain-containing protein/prepilin-type processing-associated H-X9-DG protein
MSALTSFRTRPIVAVVQTDVSTPSLRRVRRGFTLVELLVVVGIIAVLVSILLPSLSRARESAKQVQCLSNLRQLGNAFIMYTNENKGSFPRPGVGGTAWVFEDWIYWEDLPIRRLQDSAIGKYLSKPVTANVFRCPSDDMNAHQNKYVYSYSANYMVCRLPEKYFGNPYGAGEQTTPLKASQVIDAANKILLIDESTDTSDDGCWAWQQTLGSGKNVISNRHDKSKEAITNLNAGRGNANFCDGHAEYVYRKASFDPFFFDPLRRQ